MNPSSSAYDAYQQLVRQTPQQLAGRDIAEMHLLCALDLPGAEGLDVPKGLATLKEWAKRIALLTVRALPDFRRNPAAYEDCEPYFRMVVLTSLLHHEFGVHYAPERKAGMALDHEYWTSARETMLHGLLSPPHAGTCSSLPVLVVAVGRRLKYPVHLIHVPGHCFCRWDDGKVRFNIEFNGEGISCHPDEYYQRWPAEWPPELVEEERRRGEGRWFLRNMTSAEELVIGLNCRAHVLEAAGRWEETVEAYEAAARLEPQFGVHKRRREDVKLKIVMAEEILKKITSRPDYRPDRECLFNLFMVKTPSGPMVGHVYAASEEPSRPAADAYHPQPPLRGIRRALNALHEKHHPSIRPFTPTAPPTNMSKNAIILREGVST